jgi:flagellar biosynthesis/type III secretory pathway protein FliH
MTAIGETCALQRPQEAFDWKLFKQMEERYIQETHLSIEQYARKKEIEEAFEEGIREGEKEGFERGKREAFEKAFEEAKRKVKEEAKVEARKTSIRLIKKMNSQGYDIKIVAFVLDLPEAEIEKLLKEEVEASERDLSSLSMD